MHVGGLSHGIGHFGSRVGAAAGARPSAANDRQIEPPAGGERPAPRGWREDPRPFVLHEASVEQHSNPHWREGVKAAYRATDELTGDYATRGYYYDERV